MEQNNINKRSGRKCADYTKLEQEYQEAQRQWDENQDKNSWDKMWLLIQLAVFNCINKKLEHILPKEDIEERSLDVTCNIMRSLINKRNKGKKWKIEKVSSFVHLPCKYIYNEKWKFEDQILGEEAFTSLNEDGEITMMEFEDSYVDENGFYHLHGGEYR